MGRSHKDCDHPATKAARAACRNQAEARRALGALRLELHTPNRPRDPYPSLSEVVKYWCTDPVADTPALESYYIGWGEPFCFACGWLAPVRDDCGDPWRLAGGWLDRAHLQDHCYGGDMAPHNLVPLCHLCHRDMPDFPVRGDALKWVLGHARRDGLFNLFTDSTLCYRNPNRHTTLMRAKMQYLEVLHQPAI